MKKLASKLTPVQWLAILLNSIGTAIMIPREIGMLDWCHGTGKWRQEVLTPLSRCGQLWAASGYLLPLL
jgi:hypothetical protein